MNAEVKKILNDLKKKIFQPVYFIYGEEEYYHDLIEKKITEAVQEPDQGEWVIRIFYGRDISMEQLISEAKEFGMFAEKKLIIVREAQNIRELSGKHTESKNKKKSSDVFLSYLEHPSRENVLFISFKHGSPDKRSSLFKGLQKHALVLESKKIYDSQVPEWIKNYVQEHQRSIHPKAISVLSDHVGNNLNRLHLELQKLFLTVPENSEITPADVRDKVGIHKEFNIFELQHALAIKDVFKATRIALYLGENEKEYPMPVIVASLFNYFMKVLRVHFIQEQDKSQQKIASTLGINPYFVQEYLKASQHYPPGKIKKITGILKEYDLKSKGVNNVSLKQKDLVPEMIYKILH